MGLLNRQKKQQRKSELQDFYKLVPDPDDIDADYWCICLQKGEFQGLIYKYGEIGISKKLNEDGTLPVKFEYDILFVPEEIRKMEFADEKKDELEKLMGDIMMEMIQEDLESNNGTAGGDDTKEFVVKRRIHQESDSVSEK